MRVKFWFTRPCIINSRLRAALFGRSTKNLGPPRQSVKPYYHGQKKNCLIVYALRAHQLLAFVRLKTAVISAQFALEVEMNQ